MDDQEELTPQAEWESRSLEALEGFVVELIKRAPLDREEAYEAVAAALMALAVRECLVVNGFEGDSMGPAGHELIGAIEAKVDELYAKYQGIES